MNKILLILLILLSFFIIYIYVNKYKEDFNNNKLNKIAFLFLIKDSINKEELWDKFFTNVDTSKYSIYIHYKNDVKLKYFDKYKLKETVPTKWGDISLVNAQKLLLKEALKDTDNSKFIFLSDACIPIKNFDYIYHFLQNYNSYFNKEIIKNIPNINFKIHKTFQWCILNRKHANIINDNVNEVKYYEKTFAPDEIYFLTTLRKKNANNIVINNKINDFTTFVNWGNPLFVHIKVDEFNDNYKEFSSKKHRGFGSPFVYNYISDKEINYLVNDTNCLFMRKILSDTKLNESLLSY